MFAASIGYSQFGLSVVLVKLEVGANALARQHVMESRWVTATITSTVTYQAYDR